MQPATHLAEYLMEAAELGIFMLAACLFGALLEYPLSPVRQAIADPFARRALMGTAMGLTAVALIYSPWGRRSGAHMNPSLTLTFARLGRIAPVDAGFYVLAQFVGGAAGVALAALLLGRAVIAHPAVHFVVTTPGMAGLGVAFAAELSISALLMLTVLGLSDRPRLTSFTGLVCGVLVALFITLEAPLSGTSMNPARTFASALVAGDWTAIWLYATAPPLGMLLAAEFYLRRRAVFAIGCAKLCHDDATRCIFCDPQHDALRPDDMAGVPDWLGESFN